MRHWILAIALFAAGAALFSLPAVTNPADVAIGTPDSDVFNSLWLLWAVPEAATRADLSLDDFKLMVDPDGANLWPHLGNVLYPLLLAPVTLTRGPVTAANWGLVLILFLNALCAFVFLHYVVGDAAAALPPAAAFGLGSFPLAEAAYGNNELAGIFLVPLAAWAVVRSCDRPSVGRAAWAAALLLLTALWNAYYGLAVLVLAVLAAVWAWRTDHSTRPLVFTGGVLATVAAVLAPLALWLGGVAQEAGSFAAEAGAQLDLLEPFHFSRDYPNTVPYFLLLLALGITVTRQRRQTAFWWLVAGVCFLLALGDSIHVLGYDTGIPGPYRLLELLPGMERARWPYRFIVVAQLALAVVASQAVRAILEYLDTGGGRGERRFTGLLVLLGLGVSFFLVPHPALTTAPPEAYGALHEHGDGAVLELPASPNFYLNSRNLFYQTVHHHAVLAAKPLPDLPAGFAPAALAMAPELAVFNDGEPDLVKLAEVDPRAFREGLQKLGVRYVALHPLDLSDATREPVKTWLGETLGAPARTSDPAIVYVVR